MIIQRHRFGQDMEPGPSTAAMALPPGQFTLGQYFMVAVAAGVTVWIITKMFGRKS